MHNVMTVRVQKLLDSPLFKVDRNNPVLMRARRALVCQIFWLDRVATAMGDGSDYSEYVHQARVALDRGRVGIAAFSDSLRNNDCKGV
jgi:hypothetical protein